MRRIICIGMVGVLLLVSGGCGIERFEGESDDKPNTYEVALEKMNMTPCGVVVWIPRTGKRYHRNKACSGMKNPSEVTIEEAVELGFTPCGNCY